MPHCFPDFLLDIQKDTVHPVCPVKAMGVTRNRVGVPGEKELFGKGVSYCVDCDANFYREEKVAVFGNESAAVSGALTMFFYATEVHLVADQLQVGKHLDYQIKESDGRLHLGQKVKEIVGQNKVEEILLVDGQRLDVSGVFIELGVKGAIGLGASLGVALDSEQY